MGNLGPSSSSIGSAVLARLRVAVRGAWCQTRCMKHIANTRPLMGKSGVSGAWLRSSVSWNTLDYSPGNVCGMCLAQAAISSHGPRRCRHPAGSTLCFSTAMLCIQRVGGWQAEELGFILSAHWEAKPCLHWARRVCWLHRFALTALCSPGPAAQEVLLLDELSSQTKESAARGSLGKRGALDPSCFCRDSGTAVSLD